MSNVCQWAPARDGDPLFDTLVVRISTYRSGHDLRRDEPLHLLVVSVCHVAAQARYLGLSCIPLPQVLVLSDVSHCGTRDGAPLWSAS